MLSVSTLSSELTTQCATRYYGPRTHSPATPQLSERAGADACLSTLHSKIDPSELDVPKRGVASCERGYAA